MPTKKKANQAPESETTILSAPPAPAQPERDLLRAEIYKLTPEQQEDARTTLLGMILKSIADMTADSLQTVAEFIEIHENEAGYATPAEDLIVNLVCCHSRRALTPDMVASSAAKFRENFDDAMGFAERFTAQYHESLS